MHAYFLNLEGSGDITITPANSMALYELLLRSFNEEALNVRDENYTYGKERKRVFSDNFRVVNYENSLFFSTSLINK